MSTVDPTPAAVTNTIERSAGLGTERMSDHLVLEAAMQDFMRSVEITRDVRFQANLRLLRRQRASSYVISFLSLYVIALSLIPNIIELKQFQNQILLACSIILSVFIIFTSLIDASQNFFHQGELLHQCARKIATINHQLRNIDIAADPAAARKELERLQDHYKQALDDCPINHDNMDFYRELAYKPHLFERQYSEVWCKQIFRYWNKFLAVFLSWLWIMPHLVAFVIITGCVYYFVLRGTPLKP